MRTNVPSCQQGSSSIRLLLVACVASFSAVSHASADTVTWQVASGDWMTPSNWGGTLPAYYSTALIGGGTATITTIGPTCTILDIGGATGPGTVQMTGGSLHVGSNISYIYCGDTTTGTFTQSGGTCSAPGTLYLGFGSGSMGYYNLSDGLLSISGTEYVGLAGNGSFMQTGGTNSVSQLWLGWGSVGTYGLGDSGQLSAAQEFIGTDYGGASTFKQWGGSNTTGCLDIGNKSSYRLWGGTLQLTSGAYYNNGGTLDCGYAAGTLSVASSSILDLSVGSVVHAGSMTLNVGADSLLIMPAGMSLGAINNAGMFHVSGTPLLVSAGTGFAGTGVIMDPVTCQGSIQANGGMITMQGGLIVSGTGSVDLGSGYLSVQDTTSGISSGSVTARCETMAGLFTQSGGWNSPSLLDVGYYTYGGTGAYSFSGGSLQVQDEVVGCVGTGVFTQIGGVHSALGSLTLGSNASDSGTFNLSGGSLCTASLTIGSSGSGIFTQSGGTNSGPGNLYLGYYAGSSGTYNLSSGSLQAPVQYVGYNGMGTFTQTGGTNSGPSALYLAYNAGSSGTYNLCGGLLQTPVQVVGSGGTGTFTQTGGTNSGSSAFYVGYNWGSSGTYNLNGGLLQAPTQYIGYVGTGVFTQSGGTCTGPGILFLGYNLGSFGTYTLSDGSLTIGGGQYIGYSGSGVFTQIGGSNTLVNPYDLYLGFNPGSGGTYNLSGGSLSASWQYIGFQGKGFFSQSGGCNSTNDLYLGFEPGSSGTYNLSGGSLSAASQYIGCATSAAFSQSGGTNSAPSALYVGAYSGCFGTYGLSGSGLLSAAQEYLGWSGTGALAQSGGTNTVSSALYIGYNFGAAGTYSLSGNGVLSAPHEFVGSSFTTAAIFAQTGGSNSTAYLSVGAFDRYLLAGGTLQLAANGGMYLNSFGTLDGGNGTGTFCIGGSSTIDLSQGVIVNAGSMAINLGQDALLVLPNGTTSSSFGSVTGAGVVYSRGTPLVVPSGSGFAATLTISDPVSCQGWIQAAGGPINMTAGLTVSGTGSVNLGSGTLTTQDATSGISGGSLVDSCQLLAPSGSGLFTQTGGGNSTARLSIGSGGRYLLAGGTLQLAPNGVFLNSGTLDGGNGTGTFSIAGSSIVDLSQGNIANTGSAAINIGSGALLVLPTGMSSANFGSIAGAGVLYSLGSPLVVPAGSGFAGTLTINDPVSCQGWIQASGGPINMTAGLTVSGTGSVNLGSGTLTTQDATSGISGGSLTSTLQFLAPSGTGSFTQAGGINSSSGLYVGYNPSSSGSYNLSGGSLSTTLLVVGLAGTDTFTQTGGYNSVLSTLYLGYNSSSFGAYNLTGNGVLSAAQEVLDSPAIFSQTGGSNTTGYLSIGSGDKYLLAGGTLQLTTNGVYTNSGTLDGGNGNGTFCIAGSSTVDLTQGNIANTASMALNIGPGALLILPSGTTAANFGSVAGTGVLYSLGTPLVVPAGSGFATKMTINDPVSCQGWIQASGGPINMTAGLVVSGTGSVNLGSGTLTTQDETSGNLGGSLTASYQLLAPSGTGQFTQSGFSRISNLSIGSGGRYLLAGGTLQIFEGGLALAGTLDGGNMAGMLNVWSDALVDLSQGVLANTGSMSVSIGPNSLLVISSSTNPASAFGQFSDAGIIHTSGTTLTVSAGTGFYGTGVINDPVVCRGWISAMGGPLALAGGVNIAGSGSVSLGSGTLTTDNASSSFSGGSLWAYRNCVGMSGTGIFIQSGGAEWPPVYLGYNPSGSGAYNLSGGSLLGNQYVGYSGTGSLSQSGGTNTAAVGSGSVYIGYKQGSSGAYNLSGGVLTAPSQYVGYGGTGTFTQSGGTNNGGNYLALGYSTSGSGTYNLGAGRLLAAEEDVGYAKSSGTGAFVQSGGTNSVVYNLYLGYNAGSSGSYNLSSGSLQAPWQYIGSGGTGSFAQSGGTNSGANYLYLGQNLGSSGTYNLGGGSLSAGTLYVGYTGTGTFTQSGGTNSVSKGPICLGYNAGSSGTYNLSGGSLWAPSQDIGLWGVGAFTQSGGTNSTAALYLSNSSPGGSGTYSLKGGRLSTSNEYVGYPNSVAGTFAQSGGTHSISGVLTLGYYNSSSVQYNLSGGSLSANNEYLGDAYSSSAAFNQSGGTHLVSGNLDLGYYSSSLGQYNLSGGSLSAYNEYVGDASSATGVFTQSGGTNSIPGTLYLNYFSTSSCAYNLNGGMLVAGAIFSGGSSFNFSGGTLRASRPFTTSMPISLPTSGGMATFDTAGYSLTLTGALSGPGGIAKTGNGTLVLGAPDTYSGNTTILAGTLVAGYATTLQNSTVNLMANGNLSLGSGATLGGLSGNGNLSVGSGTLSIGNNAASTTYSGQLSGATGLKKIGSGTLELNGANSYLGNTAVNAGTLIAETTISLPGLLSVPSKVTVAGGATLALGVGGSDGWTIGNVATVLASSSILASGATFGFDTSGGSFAYGGNITNPALGIAKFGANALVLSGTNSYGGNTLVNAGTLIATTTASVPNLLAAPPSVSVAAGATLVLPVGGTSGYTSANIATMLSSSSLFTPGANLGLDTSGGNFACTTKNALGIVKQGGNLLVVSGTNSTGGNFIVNGGTLQLGAGTAMPGGASVSIASGAMFSMNGFSNAPSASPGTLSVQGGTFLAGFSSYGDLYFGAVTMTGGTLDCSQAGDCWLHLGGTSPTITTSAASDTAVLLGAAAELRSEGLTSLAINVAAGTTPSGIDLDVGFQLTPGASRYVVKSGPGVLRLTNSGNTAWMTVAQGTLRIDDPTLAPLGSGPLTLDGGSLLYANTAAIGSTGKGIALGAGGGTIEANGSLTLSGNITGAGRLVKTGPAKLVLSGSNSFSGGLIVNSGVVDLADIDAIPSGTSLTVGAAAAFGVTSEPILAAPATQAPVSVPEPGALGLLFVVAAIAAAAWRRVRR